LLDAHATSRSIGKKEPKIANFRVLRRDKSGGNYWRVPEILLFAIAEFRYLYHVLVNRRIFLVYFDKYVFNNSSKVKSKSSK
jgi:hypothetical protein